MSVEPARELHAPPAPPDLREVHRCTECGWAGVLTSINGRRIAQCPVCNPEYEVPRRIPRNAPCCCGSGKKFKKCCGA